MDTAEEKLHKQKLVDDIMQFSADAKKWQVLYKDLIAAQDASSVAYRVTDDGLVHARIIRDAYYTKLSKYLFI
jgi:hypothetical protein